MSKMAFAPRSGPIASLQVAAPPPPSSSVNTTRLASLVKVAECQKAKLASLTVVITYGSAGSEMSIRIPSPMQRSEEHTSELQSRENHVCRLLLEIKKIT